MTAREARHYKVNRMSTVIYCITTCPSLHSQRKKIHAVIRLGTFSAALDNTTAREVDENGFALCDPLYGPTTKVLREADVPHTNKGTMWHNFSSANNCRSSKSRTPPLPPPPSAPPTPPFFFPSQILP